jgi:aminoglycoside phosphotransferase (APT) family kinase protein
MHEQEIPITDDLIRGLIADQFPQWCGLPMHRLASAGTDHTIFRLADDLVLRLPRIHWAAGQSESDHAHLPLLQDLPLQVPLPLALGRPGRGYPCHWAVHRWIEGEPALPETLPDPVALARDLGAFVAVLNEHAINDVPIAAPDSSRRGSDLYIRDAETRSALKGIADLFDEAALLDVWESALAASRYTDRPRLIHGDLHWGNLLARNGHLAAVIDWGCLGAGDPAPDLLPAWWICDAKTRPVFLSAALANPARIARGRGWALTIAAVGLAYYRDGRNPVLAGMDEVALREILAEHTD